jgi:hypothetical protein
MSNRALAVEQHHKLMYAASVQLVTQQTKNPFAGTVTEVMAKGEAQSAADLVNAGEYAYGEERSRRNPEMPITGSRRWLVRPPVIESGDYIDIEDQLATALDAKSVYVQQHTIRVIKGKADRTVGIRRVDGQFVVSDGGILGSAVEGKRPGGAAIGLPASQIVPHGGTGLTLQKLRDAKLALKKADFGIENNDDLYGAITPEQEDDLLAIAAQAGPALNAFQIEQLREGKATRLMGVNWIITNRLPVNAAGTQRLCPFWTKKNIQMGIWQDVTGEVWNDTSAKNKPFAYVSAYVDCVRIEDRGVIAIECQE